MLKLIINKIKEIIYFNTDGSENLKLQDFNIKIKYYDKNIYVYITRPFILTSTIKNEIQMPVHFEDYEILRQAFVGVNILNRFSMFLTSPKDVIKLKANIEKLNKLKAFI